MGGYSMGGVGGAAGDAACGWAVLSLLVFYGEDDKTVLVEVKHDWTNVIEDRNFILQGGP